MKSAQILGASEALSSSRPERLRKPISAALGVKFVGDFSLYLRVFCYYDSSKYLKSSWWRSGAQLHKQMRIRAFELKGIR